jgi:uncharacterized membrane protein YraQ (UPF0718 family)
MMAGSMPWAPIIAFMVASPLSSPEGMVYSAGLFGWPFAIAFFVASILLGLLGGLAGGIFENRGWLKNQARFNQAAAARQPAPAAAACGCGSQPAPALAAVTAPVLAGPRQVMALSNVRPPSRQVALQPASCCAPALTLASQPAGSVSLSNVPASCGCDSAPAQVAVQSPAGSCACDAQPAAQAARAPVTMRRFLEELFTSAKRLLLMFAGYAFIGYFLNGLIPAAWVSTLFGSGNAYSVPLAATLGLPLYINSEASLPLVRALIDGGMSQGAAMAFLITGSGTSVGALMGALTIARWRVIALVVAVLWIGAVVAGSAYNFALGTGLI